ncbi:MAG TPA: hypothetical protein VKB42_16615 [Dongiaceae bacterium]|nr:hypothetical protein [Dongiaceae bacterium]
MPCRSFRLLFLIFLAFLAPLANAAAEGTTDCMGAARPGWTPPESWVWRQICAGRKADLEIGFPEPTASRGLSAGFITALLFDPQLKALVPHSGVHISGGEIEGPLRLDNAAPGYELSLERMHISGDVDLHGLTTAGNVSLANTRVAGSLDLNGASFGGSLRLEGLHVSGELHLLRGSIGGSAEFNDIDIGRNLDLERLSVAHNLVMRRARLPGVNLLGGSVKADIHMEDSFISGWTWMEDLQVGSDLFLERARLVRTDLKGSNIGDNLRMTGDHVAGPLNMQGIKVGQDLNMDAGSYQEVNLRDAEIGYTLRFDGSQVTGPLAAPAAHIGHTLSLGKDARFDEAVDLAYVRVDGAVLMKGSSFAKGVTLDGATIGQGLSITEGTRIVGPLSMTFAKVGSNVDLTGGSFDSVDLTGTTIGAEIRLASRGYADIAWRPAAKLVLRNVSAQALQDLPDAWPTTLDLEGFTYQRLGGYNESDSNDVASRSSESFIAWLAKQKQYSPQPYRTLSDVLRNAGFPDKAKEVLYAGYLREWNEATGIAWFWQGLRWAIIGFGLYPQRSALWILVLVPLGAFVIGFEPQVRLRAMRPIDRLIYSLDALLPFVTLRAEHGTFDFQAWPKYYLYFHKVMGYVLIAFLLSAVTSLG